MVYLIASGKSKEPEPTKIATFIWLLGTQGANIYNTLCPNDGTQDSLLGKFKVERRIPAVVVDGVEQQPSRIENVVQQRTLEQVLKKFDAHCLPQRNVAMESYKFNMILQKENQAFNDFETQLRTQLRHCEFKCECGRSYEDRMLRDRIVVGVFDKKLRLKLLDGSNEDLMRVIAICKTYEAAY